MHLLMPEEPSIEVQQQLAADIKALHAQMKALVGQDDVRYLRRVLLASRLLAFCGRVALALSFLPPVWIVGTLLLALAKTLENAEIGHNVMHGQYNFSGDPRLRGGAYEWDNVASSRSWRAVHNQRHHRYTGILEKDSDAVLFRLDGVTPWSPRHLLQIPLAAFVALFYEWVIALQALTLGDLFKGSRQRREGWSLAFRQMGPILKKALPKTFKDYVFFPLLCFPLALNVFLGNLAANIIRNVIVFLASICNHFSANVQHFREAELAAQPATHHFYRQITASANFSGGRTLHLVTGHLGYHIEHHLFPGLPSRHLPEAAVGLKQICDRYGVYYNSAPFLPRVTGILLRICRYSFP